ncbi:MAG TPA: TonB-dependent receptor [Cytophagaceae bacterium]|jgi:iron complex outermembrane receptor protein
MLESSFGAFYRYQLPTVIFESGINLNDRFIKTFETSYLNNIGSLIQPFSTNRTSINGMAGLSFVPNSFVIQKGNIASGFRSPNLAELSSNGLQEGVYRYEIGNPALKVEQNINEDITLEIQSNKSFISFSGFYN